MSDSVARDIIETALYDAAAQASIAVSQASERLRDARQSVERAIAEEQALARLSDEAEAANAAAWLKWRNAEDATIRASRVATGIESGSP